MADQPTEAASTNAAPHAPSPPRAPGFPIVGIGASAGGLEAALKLFAIGDGQWNIPELRRQLMETLASEHMFQDFVVEHTFPQIGQRTMRLNAPKIMRKDALRLILLAIEDITAHPTR